MTKGPLRVVFDNNVLISSALLPGLPREAFDKVLDYGVFLISIPTLLELADVLNRTKFDKYVAQGERMRFLVGFLKIAEMVEVTETLTVCRDPKDNMLLELAISGRADLLVTGDEDLLVLNPYRNVAIVTPREFLNLTG